MSKAKQRDVARGKDGAAGAPDGRTSPAKPWEARLFAYLFLRPAPAARPSSSKTRRRACWIVFAVLLACSSYLGFKGLGNAALWDDEAVTILVSRNLLHTGHLTGWDGRNLIGYRNGGILRDDLTPVISPLDILWGAVGLKILGGSTWAARVLFVAAGLLALAVFALLVQEEFGESDPWLWLYCGGLLCLSTAYLLYIRTSRYYALSILLSLVAFLFYRRHLKSKRRRPLVGLALACALSLLANPMLCVAFLLSLAVAHLVFHLREWTRKDWLRAALCAALFLALVAPYAVRFRIWDRPDQALGEGTTLAGRLTLLWWNVRDLTLIPCFSLYAAVGIAVLWRRRRPNDRLAKSAAEWTVFGVVNALFIGLLSPQPPQLSSIADIRYLVVSIPFLWGATGILLYRIHQWRRAVGLALFLVLVACNAPSMAPFLTDDHAKFRWLLPALWSEIHHPYPTAYGAVVDYLKANAKQDDIVASCPDLANYPIMFYLGDKVRVGCVVDHQTNLPAVTLKQLNAPLFAEENFPDWLISYGQNIQAPETLAYFQRPLPEQGGKRYQYKLAANLDVFCEQTQRPEIPWHTFGPVREFDPSFQGVFIYHKGELH
ncbi:MAG: hypothetical protein NTW86_25590 [Candidatus Sumerlaeota bacterium]|nr:hypothetical protein [Candidatus Sumerlaeota bacterium]